MEKVSTGGSVASKEYGLYAYSADVVFELCKLLSRKEAFDTKLKLDLFVHEILTYIVKRVTKVTQREHQRELDTTVLITKACYGPKGPVAHSTAHKDSG